MILYHGSYVEIKEPSLSFSRDNLDFGKGFYTTPIKEQAENGLIVLCAVEKTESYQYIL